MTREQESDLTLPPEKEERDIGTVLPWRLERGENKLNPPFGEYVLHSMMSPKEPICSFCGISTHGYKDCPVMHQYIREQADVLAQKRLGEYQQMREWVGYEPPRQTLTHQEPLRRGGESYKQGTSPDQKPPKQGARKQRDSVKAGMIGSLYP